VINAIKHGNRNDSSKRVFVEFGTSMGDVPELSIRVRDQGEGFDFRRDVDPRLPENLEKTNGRGMFLIRNFVDEVRYAHVAGKGTTVYLVKKLPRHPGRRASGG